MEHSSTGAVNGTNEYQGCRGDVCKRFGERCRSFGSTVLHLRSQFETASRQQTRPFDPTFRSITYRKMVHPGRRELLGDLHASYITEFSEVKAWKVARCSARARSQRQCRSPSCKRVALSASTQSPACMPRACQRRYQPPVAAAGPLTEQDQL
jgi:hypothetical protein